MSKSSRIETAVAVILNDIYSKLDRLSAPEVRKFLIALCDLKNSIKDEEELIRAQRAIQSHLLFSRLLEDPYTNHAFIKPRGFAGDASLIDLFYGHRSGREADTAFGRLLFEELMKLPSCDAVRFRRSYYAKLIDDIAGQHEGTTILALACGHLREGLFSRALVDKRVNVLGIDSDAVAITEAVRSLANRSVELKNRSIGEFIRRKGWGRTYSAIYAAGLFDYLDDRLAMKLIEVAFDCLIPRGTLSVTNFLPNIVERGYMDLVMDWRLVYRTEQAMSNLADKIAEKGNVCTEVDPLGSVVYLTVEKTASSGANWT
jgi:extracellular factor (EF) 3-hydroxypalmitic acid methyl ester biosynthesis protein